jgi:hypothetical protein
MKASERQQLLMSNATLAVYELRGYTSRESGIVEPMCEDDEAVAISADVAKAVRGERPMTQAEDAAIGHIVREWQRIEAAGDPKADDGRPFGAWMEEWQAKLPPAGDYVDPADPSPGEPYSVTFAADIEEGELPF